MTATQRFIKDAIKEGYKYHNNELIWDEQMQMFYVTDGNGGFKVSNYHEILLDPKAWEAVGKARGWHHGCQVPRLQIDILEEWEEKMSGLTPALIEGKTIEEYLISIEE